MDMPAFLRFKPVPLRAQHNGWSPALQFRFILALARGASVEEAVRTLGKTRQSVYQLRRKPGAAGFAAAWDSALAFGRKVAEATHASARLGGGTEMILVPRYYRGRLVGYIQREDSAGAMHLLARLDRVADRISEDDSRRAQEALQTYRRRVSGIDGIDENPA